MLRKQLLQKSNTFHSFSLEDLRHLTSYDILKYQRYLENIMARGGPGDEVLLARACRPAEICTQKKQFGKPLANQHCEFL